MYCEPPSSIQLYLSRWLIVCKVLLILKHFRNLKHLSFLFLSSCNPYEPFSWKADFSRCPMNQVCHFTLARLTCKQTCQVKQKYPIKSDPIIELMEVLYWKYVGDIFHKITLKAVHLFLVGVFISRKIYWIKKTSFSVKVKKAKEIKIEPSTTSNFGWLLFINVANARHNCLFGIV